MGCGKFRFFLLAFTILSLRCALGGFTPVDNYLIDCGSPTNTTVDLRTFVADVALSMAAVSTPQTIMANVASNSASLALYKTARVFTGKSFYSFPIRNQGRHFIRLYFYPFVYQSYNLTAATFTVSTQDFVLLDNFRVAEASSLVFKEFLMNITRDTLAISFMPSGTINLAFVNAIEVVSVPDDLIIDTAQIISPVGTYHGLLEKNLETVYRINNGGPSVAPNNDSLWRTWVNDGSFLLDKSLSKSVSYTGKINYLPGSSTKETAPDSVYSTATELATSSNTSNAFFNVTWQLDVDTSTAYLVRMHFCDIVSKSLNQLYFNIYIGDFSAAQGFDITTRTAGTLAAALFSDFVVTSTTDKLTISVGPSTLDGISPDGILNGLEVMKISSSGSGIDVKFPRSKLNLSIILGSVLGVLAAMIVAVVVFMLLRRRNQAGKYQPKGWLPFSFTGGAFSRFSNGTTVMSSQNGSFGYRFAFVVLQEATNNFDEKWVIGVGGFGKVYKGVLRDETRVAVKRGNPKSQQGINEFRTEIELLSRLRHRHLVSLIGYCDERNEMILVYEYMEEGTVKSHLYGADLPNLSWKERLEVCIGAARGLHYLHTGQAKAIIHRDVKSANILLDENLMAKVSDFGLSKTGPELDQTHVSTAVKGSFGYLDPEYFRRQQLTDKSDVYSFGVVLLEVLCARPVLDPTLPREMVNLAEWGIRWQKKGELDQIIDSRISGTINPDSLKKFGETVEKCLSDYGVDRPSMGDVLWNLEYALQLQEVASGDTEVNSIAPMIDFSLQIHDVSTLNENVVAGGAVEASQMNGHNDLSEVSMSRVFSQLIKAEGR